MKRKLDYKWDTIWLAFKLRYCDVVGIKHRHPGGMIRYLQEDSSAEPVARDSLIGKKMTEFGLELTDFRNLRAAARRDRKARDGQP